MLPFGRIYAGLLAKLVATPAAPPAAPPKLVPVIECPAAAALTPIYCYEAETFWMRFWTAYLFE